MALLQYMATKSPANAEDFYVTQKGGNNLQFKKGKYQRTIWQLLFDIEYLVKYSRGFLMAQIQADWHTIEQKGDLELE